MLGIADARVSVDNSIMLQLRQRIDAKFADPGTKFFDMLEYLVDDDTGRANVQKAVDWLMRANTAYRSWNLPRMPGITGEIVRIFFERVEQMASKHGEPLVAMLVGAHQLPTAQPKLHKSGRELWASWGFLK